MFRKGLLSGVFDQSDVITYNKSTFYIFIREGGVNLYKKVRALLL